MPEDVYLTVGCTQAIEIIVSVLARPGANILLPKPGYPQYEARAAFDHLEVRHFNLIPEKGWEVDLDSIEALVDHNTAAIVVINPSNPCGNVFTYQHLKKVRTVQDSFILQFKMKCVNHIASNMLFEFAHKIYRSNDVVYMLATNILEVHYSYSYNDLFLSILRYI